MMVTNNLGGKKVLNFQETYSNGAKTHAEHRGKQKHIMLMTFRQFDSKLMEFLPNHIKKSLPVSCFNMWFLEKTCQHLRNKTGGYTWKPSTRRKSPLHTSHSFRLLSCIGWYFYCCPETARYPSTEPPKKHTFPR